jgi:pimeloyl-[acyl-carrier protein] methyl ester esterase
VKNLVLLHGWGASGQVWRRQVMASSGLGFRVLAPTFPAWEARWLSDYLQKLPLADTVLVGWSLGGMLLLEALSLEPLEPGGLILVATPASFCRRPDHSPGQPPAVVRAMRRALLEDKRRVLADFAARCLAPEEALFRGGVLGAFLLRGNGADLAAGLDYLLDTDLRPGLSRVPAGAFILQGDRDAIVPPAQAEVLGQHLRDSRLVSFPGAGHAPFITQASRFNEVLAKALGKVL